MGLIEKGFDVLFGGQRNLIRETAGISWSLQMKARNAMRPFGRRRWTNTGKSSVKRAKAGSTVL